MKEIAEANLNAAKIVALETEVQGPAALSTEHPKSTEISNALIVATVPGATLAGLITDQSLQDLQEDSKEVISFYKARSKLFW